MRYVGSTITPVCTRFNNYKSNFRRFERGEAVAQTNFSGILNRQVIVVLLKMLVVRLWVGCLASLGPRKVFVSLK